ncbi:MAG: hypothetical protein GKS00_12805 [Alphaproteobacteria bacterium]|nr:hypothetical protein [Alphaproteobacteria bacterium]
MGFIGLILFLLLLMVAWRNAQIVIRISREAPELEWAKNLAAMLQVSMVGYGIGGMALSVAYYDMVFTLIAILELLKSIAVKSLENRTTINRF